MTISGQRIGLLPAVLLFCAAPVLCSAPAAAQDEAIAEAVPAASQEAPSDDNEPAVARAQRSARPLTVAASLTDKSVITGTLLDSTSLNIRTAFGEASLPLSEVAGIRFPTGDDSGTTVVMLNGDSITGATDLKFISVETTWGSAKINGDAIGDLLFVPGLAWQSSESLGRKRWALVEKSPVGQSAVTQGGVQPATGTRPIPQQRSGVLPSGTIQRQPTPAPIIYGR